MPIFLQGVFFAFSRPRGLGEARSLRVSEPLVPSVEDIVGQDVNECGSTRRIGAVVNGCDMEYGLKN